MKIDNNGLNPPTSLQSTPNDGNQPPPLNVNNKTNNTTIKPLPLISHIKKALFQFKELVHSNNTKIHSRKISPTHSTLIFPEKLSSQTPHKHLTEFIKCSLNKDSDGMITSLMAFRQQYLQKTPGKWYFGADDDAQFFDSYANELLDHGVNRSFLAEQFRANTSALRQTFLEFNYLMEPNIQGIELTPTRGNLVHTAITLLNLLALCALNDKTHDSAPTTNNEKESKEAPYQAFLDSFMQQLDTYQPSKQTFHRNLCKCLSNLPDNEIDQATLHPDNQEPCTNHSKSNAGLENDAAALEDEFELIEINELRDIAQASYKPAEEKGDTPTNKGDS